MLGPAISAISLALLGASGVAKILDPAPTTGALRAARLPSGNSVSRVIGVAEIAAATLGLALGGTALAGAAMAYAAFTLFTLAALRGRIPLQSCGCFGSADTPPSSIHVVYNSVATMALTWLAVSGASAVPWDASRLEVSLFLVFAGIGAYASYLLLARLPSTLQAAGAR